MPVTEFAVFTLRDSYDPIELLEVVMECQEVQDDWVRANHPNDCAKRACVSRMYTDTTLSPDRVAITAPWQSPAAHHEWIDTAANRGIMARFAAFLPGGAVPDHHCDDAGAAASPHPGFLFFHMDTAGRRAVLHQAFSSKEALVVTRLAAQGGGAGGREQLQAAYRQLEEALVAEDPKDRVWAGWRIEKEKDQEELVVFRNADLDANRLAPLQQHGKPIGRELHLREIAP
ncbi:hypothetical protein ISF_07469 [Cordyceps fumosorosea ARSEF 2679]|uniref:ABM domain-containing protein n=1 Tax=Cordyceps fumosorosea (strain ARSEF 2679) TaxID=1081104 RepID=A0A167P8Q7_CORFA|nr:hypothetical protein ISF_07469 [Cordyceps fumosorosea ARSEF 2679]OAA56401.1 hypothetical protein ISF_07469 [Cordyceps fumosorosea ARSEF 2679]